MTQDRRTCEPAGRGAFDGHVMAGKLLCQLWIDADRKKLALAVGQRLPQRSLHRVGADRNFRDLVLFEQCFELAIGYSLDLRVARPKLLK